MAGFFKKLFNRIAGKAEEPVDVAQPALPAPVEETIVASKPVIPATLPAIAKRKPEMGVPPKPKADAVKVAKSKANSAKSTKKLPPSKSTPKTVIPAKAEIQLKPKADNKKRDSRLRGKDGVLEAAKLDKKLVVPKTIAPQPATPAAIQVQPAIPPRDAPKPVPQDSRLRENDNETRGGWFSRLKQGLSKSSKSITGSITSIFTQRKLDRETLQELEDTLIQADLGIAVSERIIAAVSHGRYDKEIDPEEVMHILADEVTKVLKPVEVPFNFGSEKPYVILVVGVNGAGKTTTIGKLGSIAAGEGYKVMFAACDTFRAAAVEQLTVWGKRIGAVTKSAAIGADAAGLAFDALKQARDDGTDILFIDTAGRLQNKTHLMDELDKVVRVIKKMDQAAPHAVLLVLDATTGQNALAQAEIFAKVAGVTGLIMTKLDGTARGGILVAIAEKFKLPIHAIGVGEGIDDLQPFDAASFARAIAGLEN
jgi:fused signal recognition particle receptor